MTENTINSSSLHALQSASSGSATSNDIQLTSHGRNAPSPFIDHDEQAHLCGRLESDIAVARRLEQQSADPYDQNVASAIRQRKEQQYENECGPVPSRPIERPHWNSLPNTQSDSVATLEAASSNLAAGATSSSQTTTALQHQNEQRDLSRS